MYGYGSNGRFATLNSPVIIVKEREAGNQKTGTLAIEAELFDLTLPAP
jgi:hypothetical protein